MTENSLKDVKDSFYRFLSYIYTCLIQAIYGVDEKRACFQSFQGNAYSDNPRAISEKLHEIGSSAEIVWLMKESADLSELPPYVRVITFNSKAAMRREIARSGVFVTNFSIPYIRKSKKQFFIQTWHGDRAIKKILYDSGYRGSKSVIPESLPGFCDLAVAGSEAGKQLYRTAFRYNGEIYSGGCPRNDALVNGECASISAEARKRLTIPENAKIMLYAPTFRAEPYKNHTSQDAGNIDVGLIRRRLEKATGEKWMCLVRSHANVKGISGVAYDENIREVSDYPDMRDLLCLTDFLITDYSSSATDFQLTGRPMVLYQPDRDDYNRGFYFDLDDSPFLIAKNMDELLAIADKINVIDFKDMSLRLNRFFGVTENGHSAEDLAQVIEKQIYNGECKK